LRISLDGLDVLHIDPEDLDLFADSFREMGFSDDYFDMFKKRLQRTAKIKERRREFMIQMEDELSRIHAEQDVVFAEWKAVIDKSDRVISGEIKLSPEEISELQETMTSLGKKYRGLVEEEGSISINNIEKRRIRATPEEEAARMVPVEEASIRTLAEAGT